MRRLSVLAAMVLLLGGVEQATAGSMAGIQSYTNGVVYPNADNQDWSLGFEFAVHSPVTVSALGYNYFGTPLNSSHQVGIYDASATLVASATVNNASTASNGYLYTSLTSPVVLGPGNYFIVGTTLGLNDGWTYQAQNIVTMPAISYVDSFYASGNGGNLEFPSNSTFGGRQYLEVNFQSPLASTPEPASLTLFGISMAGIGGYSWRRRKQAIA